MAGHGPPPKDPAHRARRNAPARGEWTDLPPLSKPVLPAKLPTREQNTGVWCKRTKETWAAWRQDPVTRTWSPADIALALNLIFAVEEVNRGNVKWANFARLREDSLGLSPKGKRDLRFRVLTSEDAAAKPAGQLVGIEGGRAVSARERVLGP